MPSPFNQLFGNVDEAKTDPNTGATTDETSGALTGPEGGNDEPNQPKETGYVNFADVYNLNQDKGTEMAGRATKAVTEPLGDLKGYQPPKTGLMTPQADAPTASRAGPSNQVQAPLLQMTGQPASNILSTQLASDQNSPFGSLSNWGGTALPATPDVGDIPQGYINARTASAAEGVGDIPQGYTDARQASANAPLHTSPAVTNGDTTATEKVATPAEAQAAAIAGGAPTNADGTPFDGIWGEKSEVDALKTKTAADLEALKAKDATASETEAANQTKYDQAQTKLDAYKSDGGKALLGDNANVYDAAIMNQAGGRDAFAALNKQFGGYGDKYAARTLADKNVRKGNIDQMGHSLNALNNAKTYTKPVVAADDIPQAGLTPEQQAAKNHYNNRWGMVGTDSPQKFLETYGEPGSAGFSHLNAWADQLGVDTDWLKDEIGRMSQSDFEQLRAGNIPESWKGSSITQEGVNDKGWRGFTDTSKRTIARGQGTAGIDAATQGDIDNAGKVLGVIVATIAGGGTLASEVTKKSDAVSHDDMLATIKTIKDYKYSITAKEKAAMIAYSKHYGGTPLTEADFEGVEVKG